MKGIFDIRFIVPPTLTIILIFSFFPIYFLHLLSHYHHAEILIAILSSIVLILGVIISAIGEIWIRYKKLRAWGYTKEEWKILQDDLRFEGDRSDDDYLELGTWLILGNLDRTYPHIQSQIQKRWYWSTANLNLSIASFLAVLIVIILLRVIPFYMCGWSIIWLSIVIIISTIFIYNGLNNYKSVCKMHKLLLKNYTALNNE